MSRDSCPMAYCMCTMRDQRHALDVCWSSLARVVHILTACDVPVLRQVGGDTKAPQLDGRGVLLGGQQDAVRLEVAVHDAVGVAVPQGLQNLTHVVAAAGYTHVHEEAHRWTHTHIHKHTRTNKHTHT